MGDLFDFPQRIPTLSLWEPWASLIVSGFKAHETRSWSTQRRGLIAIHASRTLKTPLGRTGELCRFALGDDWRSTRPLGCVLAVADLTACIPTRDAQVSDCDRLAGDYSEGRFALRLEQVRPLREPLPLIGRQGFFYWTAPADLEAQLTPPLDQGLSSFLWDDAGQGFVERARA